jgi:hypothetical protein
MSGTKLTSALLRRAYRIAVAHSEISALVTAAMRERYGVTHSDVDCDDLIDPLEYGQGGCPTLARCDAAMAVKGAPAKARGQS